MPSIFDKPSLTAQVAPTDANPTPLPEVKQDVFGQVQAHFDAKDLERQKLEATKTEPSKLSQQVKADVAVAKSRQIQQTLAVMPDFVQKYVLGSEGEEPDQAEWEQIVPEEYRSETRIDGIARVEGVTRAELRANVEYMRNQDEAALLNDGVGLADVASIATGMLFPSPTDMAMMAVSGGMDKAAKLGYSLGRRLLLEPLANVALEAELLQSQGRKMTDQQMNAQLASNMAFVAGTHLVGKVIRLGSSKFNAGPEVNFADHSVNESVIDPMSPPSEAEIKGAELTLVTHGSIPIEESAAAVQRRFDEVNMKMPKKAPTKPKEAPRFDEATVEPAKAPTPEKERTTFRQGDIVIGKVIIKPRSKTDADILRWPLYDELSSPDKQFSHVSPYDFTEFDLSKIGTGEGAQAQGYGIYLAESGGVIDFYQKTIPYKHAVRNFLDALPENADFEEVLAWAPEADNKIQKIIYALSKEQWLGFDYPAQAITAAMFHLSDFIDASSELKDAVANYTKVYSVSIKQSDYSKFLDLDKHVGENSRIFGILRADNTTSAIVGDGNVSGRQLYFDLAKVLGSKKAASEKLNSIGIKGNIYFDKPSRANKSGTRNVVVFDTKITTIHNGEAKKPIDTTTRDRLTANIALSVEGFNPNNTDHIQILQNVSNDAAKQIEDGLHPRERGSSETPLSVKKIDNMRLVEDLQARIDEYAMKNPTVKSPEDWPTNVRAPVESVGFQIDRATEVKAVPIGAEGVGEPIDARALRKMNKAMREINRRMGDGKQYKSTINELLADPDTLALGPEAIEKLKALRDLKDLKFTPDQTGFINGPALKAISQVLQAIDQQKMRTRVSRAADKNANEAVRANLRGMAYDGDVRRALDAYEEAYAKYLKDKEAYDSDRALAKNLGADGDELPEPMPPAKPKIEASAMIEAAKKSIGAVSGTFGEMPYFGDMTAGKSPMSGIGAMLLANPELRAGIPGVGNLASALAYAQRTAHMTFLEGVQHLDAGTLSTLAHFLTGYNAEEQKQMLFAMWNGTHSNPSYAAIAKHFRDWWDVKQKELAKNGLLTGVITNFAPQDTDKDKIIAMGQKSFVALAKDWFDPSHGKDAAALYFEAVAEEPKSAQYPHATRMYQRTFKMRDAESAWKLISHFGEKPYALMVMDKVSQIEAKLAAAKLLGPEPAKVLRGVVEDAASEAIEAWNKATPEERKKNSALDPTTIARWKYVMAGQDGFGGVIGGMFGQYNVTPQSNASALAMAADAAGSVLVGGLSASASRFVPSDLWRSSVFIANQMPYGGGHNPVNLGIGFAKIMREMMHAIGEWQNPETGKRGSRGDIEEILDGMGYNIATARALQVQSQFAQHGMGDTPVQEFKNGAGRIFTKGTRTLASILAQSQFMWQANHAQKYAGLEAIITNFGNQIAKSGGNFDALKNGGWNAYNAWVKMRQGGFDNAKFKQLHDAAVNSGALRQVKTWLTGKQHAVDTQMLYHADPVVGNLFINMIEENYKAGVRDSGAYERHIRRAGGALLTSMGQRSITQQGTWPGMFANASASFTNVLTATQNDFVMENSINGMLGLAAPSIGQLGAAVIGVAAWAIIKDELTVEELENNPSILWNNPHYLGKIVDESGIMAQFGLMASLYGDHRATTVNGISLTKKKKGFVSPLEAVAEGLSSSVTDKPAFQMAGNLAALASGTLGEAEVFGPSLSKFPSWREKLGYFTKPLVPNPLLANLFHMNLQDLYMRQVAPIAQSRIEMNRAVRIGIMNRGSNNGDN